MGTQSPVTWINLRKPLRHRDHHLTAKLASHNLRAEFQKASTGLDTQENGKGADGQTFSLNIFSPEESTAVIKESLQNLNQAEQGKLKQAYASFSADKERMLEAERRQLDNIVAKVFSS